MHIGVGFETRPEEKNKIVATAITTQLRRLLKEPDNFIGNEQLFLMESTTHPIGISQSLGKSGIF